MQGRFRFGTVEWLGDVQVRAARDTCWHLSASWPAAWNAQCDGDREKART